MLVVASAAAAAVEAGNAHAAAAMAMVVAAVLVVAVAVAVVKAEALPNTPLHLMAKQNTSTRSGLYNRKEGEKKGKARREETEI